ncbi:MAG TPA: DMT family transporter [Candidatus Baltobacteraceae bacterium]|nr:DMT family transporter [Candidatus Baltobacteraceae bacterium]
MTHSHYDLVKGILAGLGSGLNWSVTSLIAVSLLERIAPIKLSAIRSTVGGGLLILWAVAAGEGPDMLNAPLWAVLSLWIAILIGMGIGDTCFFRSLDYLGLTLALSLSLVNPLITTVTGIVVFREPMTFARFIGIVLVICGLGLIIAGRHTGGGLAGRADRRGIRLVLIAALTWALSAIMVKPALEQLPVLAGTALRIPAAGLVLWLTPWTRGTLEDIRAIPRDQLWRLGAVCVMNVVGSALFSVAIRSGGVAIGNALASTAPLFAIPLEIGLLKHRPSRQTIAGAVLSVTGIGLLGF